jgi:hypothetical protein
MKSTTLLSEFASAEMSLHAIYMHEVGNLEEVASGSFFSFTFLHTHTHTHRVCDVCSTLSLGPPTELTPPPEDIRPVAEPSANERAKQQRWYETVIHLFLLT